MTALKDERFKDLRFIDQAEATYFAQAQLGDDVRAFLTSPVGKYLHGCAKQELEAVRDAMEDFNPNSFWGRRKLRKLQIRAKAARMFMAWCAEAITQGEMSYQQLKEYRSE